MDTALFPATAGPGSIELNAIISRLSKLVALSVTCGTFYMCRHSIGFASFLFRQWWCILVAHLACDWARCSLFTVYLSSTEIRYPATGSGCPWNSMNINDTANLLQYNGKPDALLNSHFGFEFFSDIEQSQSDLLIPFSPQCVTAVW